VVTDNTYLRYLEAVARDPSFPELDIDLRHAILGALDENVTARIREEIARFVPREDA
jgi:hypothetical protein